MKEQSSRESVTDEEEKKNRSKICPEYAYIWNVNLGEWLFISADYLNFIYRAEKDAWLYYGTGTAVGDGRVFYDFNQSQWVHESEL